MSSDNHRQRFQEKEELSLTCLFLSLRFHYIRGFEIPLSPLLLAGGWDEVHASMHIRVLERDKERERERGRGWWERESEKEREREERVRERENEREGVLMRSSH